MEVADYLLVGVSGHSESSTDVGLCLSPVFCPDAKALDEMKSDVRTMIAVQFEARRTENQGRRPRMGVEFLERGSESLLAIAIGVWRAL